jgi:hypothetical protein
MDLMKKYFKNRELFELNISSFFNEINFNYNLSSHLFVFIDNKKLYIISYDLNFDKNLDLFNITDINNNIIFETNNITDLRNKLYTFKSIQYYLRLKKYIRLIV